MSTALKSRAEHLEEGKALRKPPSFFQLGHEVEGRFYEENAFMPSSVLTVARGFVEYQMTAEAAALAASAARKRLSFPLSLQKHPPRTWRLPRQAQLA